MKKIPLRNRRKEVVAFALIDDEDYESIQTRTWCLFQGKYSSSSYPRPSILMHHFILGKPDRGKEVDHINHNGLDNRKKNLRLVSRSENNMNRSVSRHNTSGCIGVAKGGKTSATKWRAYTSINNKQIHLGIFKTKLGAVRARKKYEKEFFKNLSIQKI